MPTRAVSTRIFQCLPLINMSGKRLWVPTGPELQYFTRLAGTGFVTLYSHLLNICMCLSTSKKQMPKEDYYRFTWGAHPWRQREESWRRKRRPHDDEVLTLVQERDGRLSGKSLRLQWGSKKAFTSLMWSFYASHPSGKLLVLQQRVCVNNSSCAQWLGAAMGSMMSVQMRW